MKSKIILFISLAIVFFTACKDDDNTLGSDFHIVKTEIVETPELVTGKIILSSENFDYEVRHDWCDVVKEGNKLHVNTGVNMDFMNRTTEIKIYSGDKTFIVPITQTGILLDFGEGSDSKFNFNYNGGTRTVRILSNVDYKIVIPDEFKSWLSVEETSEDIYKIQIAKSTVNRLGALSFEYLGKKIEINVRQYNFLSYQQLLGEVTLSYKNSLGDNIVTQVVLTENVPNKIFNVTGIFESGVERTFPMTYVEDADGELRFHPAMLEKPYTDPANSSVGSLTLLIQATQLKVGNLENIYLYPNASGLKQYYPGKAEFADVGSFYKFAHSSVGVPDGGVLSIVYPRKTLGMVIAAASAAGTSRYITYDTLFDIEITKEVE